MKYGYTADEVFELAEDIEREGHAFYRRAAEKCEGPDKRRLLLELAATCEHHIETLRTARTCVNDKGHESGEAHRDPMVAMYLKTIARGTVYETPEHLNEVLSRCESEDDVLSLAVNKELDAMLYFFEMKDLIITEAARTAVEEVIRQKREHVMALSTSAKAAKTA